MLGRMAFTTLSAIAKHDGFSELGLADQVERVLPEAPQEV